MLLSRRIGRLVWEFVERPRILAEARRARGRHQMTPDELVELVRILRLSAPRTAAEIGSFCGVTSRVLASRLAKRPGARLYCIDPFESGAPLGDYYGHRYTSDEVGFDYEQVFDSNVRKFGSTVVKLKGMSGSVPLPDGFSPEFLFIDGDHSVEGVTEDIRRYVPKLPVGGYVCFHDVTIGRSGTLRALLETLWPAPNSLHFRLVSHVGSLLSIQKISETPPQGWAVPAP